jgi:hypothetical protein
MESTRILKFMHISVDDVNIMLKELSDKNYKTIYQHEIFNFLKSMHDQYGAVFSLYCFYQNPEDPLWTLSNMTDQYRNEFEKASSWLKFGFHAQHSSTKYNETVNPETALEHYTTFVDAVRKFAGSASIDRIPRIHYFMGNKEQTRKWKNAEYGVEGFLSADDTREVNGYLNANERSILEKYPFYYEAEEKLYFLKTNFRLERISNVHKELEVLSMAEAHDAQHSMRIIFTHENPLRQEQIQDRLEDCCRWALDNHYIFMYPMQFVRQIV